jgi:hypothetical protein
MDEKLHACGQQLHGRATPNAACDVRARAADGGTFRDMLSSGNPQQAICVLSAGAILLMTPTASELAATTPLRPPGDGRVRIHRDHRHEFEGDGRFHLPTILTLGNQASCTINGLVYDPVAKRDVGASLLSTARDQRMQLIIGASPFERAASDEVRASRD